jgi:hypothetical protein
MSDRGCEPCKSRLDPRDPLLAAKAVFRVLQANGARPARWMAARAEMRFLSHRASPWQALHQTSMGHLGHQCSVPLSEGSSSDSTMLHGASFANPAVIGRALRYRKRSPGSRPSKATRPSLGLQ